MTLEELRAAVDAGTVDTVLLAITDMQGRLQGKRLHARFFVDEVADHGAEGCNYLLAVDVDMATVDGVRDGLLGARLRRLRHAPGPGHAAPRALAGGDRDVPGRRGVGRRLRRSSPRRARSCAPSSIAWPSAAGAPTPAPSWSSSSSATPTRTPGRRATRGLDPANLYNVDYSLLGTARVEPLIRRIRNAMYAAGMAVEDSKGECNLGQHEINFHYDSALATADAHAIYKNGAKEIAAQEGMSITFMAKWDEREGNSCHIHFSLADADGPLFPRDQALFDAFLAGQLACLRELTLLLAPNVNSYKRYAAGSFAPTAVAWGHDNRTCALRVVGHGPGMRFENRTGGGDLNPYLALSALIAAGLHGVDAGLELEPELVGNAYTADKPRVPTTLREARDLFAGSAVARAALGDEVVDHYVNAADVELAAFEAAVTDWERFRGFERL